MTFMLLSRLVPGGVVDARHARDVHRGAVAEPAPGPGPR